MKIADGARLMRDSYAVVRRNPTLLWFPVMSTVCLAITAGYWVLEGKSLYDGHSNVLVLVPVVLAALYTLSFVAVRLVMLIVPPVIVGVVTPPMLLRSEIRPLVSM